MSLKREVHKGSKKSNATASVFEKMLNATDLSAEDMKLVLENHNVNMSLQRLEQSRHLVSIIDVLLGGKGT
jgi:hypothetical protein